MTMTMTIVGGSPSSPKMTTTGLGGYPQLLEDRPLTAVARQHVPVRCSFAEFAKQHRRSNPQPHIEGEDDRKLRLTRSTTHLHTLTVNPEDIPRVATPNYHRPTSPPIRREDILQRISMRAQTPGSAQKPKRGSASGTHEKK